MSELDPAYPDWLRYSVYTGVIVCTASVCLSHVYLFVVLGLAYVAALKEYGAIAGALLALASAAVLFSGGWLSAVAICPGNALCLYKVCGLASDVRARATEFALRNKED